MMEHIMLYIRRILFMVRKEMLTTLKDPKSRIILIMPVIIQSLLCLLYTSPSPRDRG